ncbi:hypothetical protein D4R87_00600 [bacterium]|nr:MAG: hypothetical protein D4R87_00600 [bacterium]
MGGRSKNKNRKAERKSKSKDWHINIEAGKFERTKQIDQSVAIRAEVPDYEDKLKENFLFSFAHYKIGQCGLKDLYGKDSKQLIEKLRRINETTIRELPSSKLIHDNVKKGGNYKSLFDGLSPDVEIREIRFSDSGRIFAYFVERYVCIVAIKPNHIKI